jgi:hypothetical protein
MMKVKNNPSLSDYRTVGPAGCRTKWLSEYSYAPDETHVKQYLPLMKHMLNQYLPLMKHIIISIYP